MSKSNDLDIEIRTSHATAAGALVTVFMMFLEAMEKPPTIGEVVSWQRRFSNVGSYTIDGETTENFQFDMWISGNKNVCLYVMVGMRKVELIDRQHWIPVLLTASLRQKMRIVIDADYADDEWMFKVCDMELFRQLLDLSQLI